MDGDAHPPASDDPHVGEHHADQHLGQDERRKKPGELREVPQVGTGEHHGQGDDDPKAHPGGYECRAVVGLAGQQAAQDQAEHDDHAHRQSHLDDRSERLVVSTNDRLPE